MKKFISPKIRVINYEANAIMETSNRLYVEDPLVSGNHKGDAPIRIGGVFYTDDKQQESIW